MIHAVEAYRFRKIPVPMFQYNGISRVESHVASMNQLMFAQRPLLSRNRNDRHRPHFIRPTNSQLRPATLQMPYQTGLPVFSSQPLKLRPARVRLVSDSLHTNAYLSWADTSTAMWTQVLRAKGRSPKVHDGTDGTLFGTLWFEVDDSLQMNR